MEREIVSKREREREREGEGETVSKSGVMKTLTQGQGQM